MEDKDLIGVAGKELARKTFQARWEYYMGEQPRVWVTPKLRAMFRTLADSMSENYCDLAIHARSTRMEIEGWEGAGTEQADQLWTDTNMGKRQADFYRWGLVYGRVYLICADEEDGQKMSPNRPTVVWHIPKDDNPLEPEVAVKYWWAAGQGIWRATIYDEEEIRRYENPEAGQRPSRRPDASRFVLDLEEPGGRHGFERCPVVPTYPYGMDAPCLLDTIAPIQDRINKIGSNKFIAAEFGAFRQRVFLTKQDVDDNDLKSEPDSAIILHPGDRENPTSVVELTATELKNYDDAKAAEVDALFTLALLPRHLRISGQSAEAPSGRAIKADEGPLIEAVYDHHREFGEAVTDALAILGIDAEPVWRNPVSDDEMDQGTTVKLFSDAGLSAEAAARKYAGWTDEDFAAAPAVEGSGDPATATDAPAASATGAALLNAFNSSPAG